MEQVQILGRDADYLKIALSGDIDLGNAEAFYNEVTLAYQEKPGNILFDCEKLNYVCQDFENGEDGRIWGAFDKFTTED